MSRTIKLFLAAILIAILAPLTANLFSTPRTDAEKIQAAIKQIAEGAENADIVMCMEPFSASYQDPEGMEKRSIHGVLWQHFRKRGPLMVWLGDIAVDINGNDATATFDVGLAEGAENSVVPWPVSADILNFELELAKEEDGWRITSHTRKPATIQPSAG